MSGFPDVVEFWRAAGAAGQWFEKSDAFDEDFRTRFLDLHFAAARRECESWIELPEGALALLVLLDQFPRNAFRGTGHMYATDGLARRYARIAEARGHIEGVEHALRGFFALPFSHSEDAADQELSVALNRRFALDGLSYAEHHHDIVRRFGRFPHRNPILGRETTPEEEEFLREGGFTG